jgi:hypothetical protein
MVRPGRPHSLVIFPIIGIDVRCRTTRAALWHSIAIGVGAFYLDGPPSRPTPKKLMSDGLIEIGPAFGV